MQEWYPDQEGWEYCYCHREDAPATRRRIKRKKGPKRESLCEVKPKEQRIEPLQRVLTSDLAKVPVRSTPGSFGYDLCSIEGTTVPPQGVRRISTGISMEVKPGWYGRVVPCPGLPWTRQVTVGTAVIDPDCQGVVKVLLFNYGDKDFRVACGMKIAQMLLERLADPPAVPNMSFRAERISTLEELYKVQQHAKEAEGAAPAPPQVAPVPKLITRELAEESGRNTWASASAKPQTWSRGHEDWMIKLARGDLSGVLPKKEQYLELRDVAMAPNPRGTKEYKEECVRVAGLGPDFDEERYPHLVNPADRALLAFAIERGSGCIWLDGTERTYVRGFRHRLITRGLPVRTGLHRLSRQDTEWVEKAVQEDVQRGQLVKGSSEWGAPGFPTKQSAPHKAIIRKRRMVVDYRALNKVTVRKVFLIPNSEQIKSNVAGSKFISVGDAVAGFNQVENEPESARKMAVLVASGTYLPRGLTFGPTNGPVDFQ